MIGLVGLAIAAAWVVTARYGLDRALEVVKEFGGGYGAYWTHHVFHKLWHASGRTRVLRRRRGA